MKILIVTDAWHPQVNGVVTTLDELGRELQNAGHEIVYLTNEGFKTVALPFYPEIKIAVNPWKVFTRMKEIAADAIHIATPEAPIGLTARLYCVRNSIPYTSSYHTKFPEYINMLTRIPKWVTYAFLRWAHKDSKAILVPTMSMVHELEARGFKSNLVVWTRGCDHEIFDPSLRTNKVSRLSGKVLLYAGRVSIEKNLEAFLKINIPGTRKVVVGDGPERKKLERRYRHIEFTGYKRGKELAQYMANADVFVFPSKTDTFGIVMIEAATCGTPVAAYPVTGPVDFVEPGMNGALDNNLEKAIEKALQIDRNACFSYTKEHFTWKKCAEIFLSTLVPIKCLSA